MLDIALLIVTILFFLSCFGLIGICKRLLEG